MRPIPNITIRNYRRFTADSPATFALDGGAVAFVGVNNSGKSSLLRFFYDYRDVFRRLATEDGLRIARQQSMVFNLPAEVRDPADNFSLANALPLEIQFDWPTHKRSDQIARLVVSMERAAPRRFTTSVSMGATRPSATPKAPPDETPIRDELPADSQPVTDLMRTLSSTLYVGPFRNVLDGQYFSSSNGTKYFDIDIGSNLVSEWRNLKGGTSRRDRDLSFTLRSDIARLFEFEDFEIDASNDGGLLLRIDKEQHYLADVGSGLSQFIAVLLNAATKPNSMILIDEPELHLHPRLQIDFLSALGDYAPEGLFFSTHSLGLARLYADRVYAVQPTGVRESRLDPFDSTPTLSGFLGALGYAAGADGGPSKVLLVEGPTDVRVFRQFLHHLGERDTVIVHLGGGNSIRRDAALELQDLSRLAPTVSAVIDSERERDGAPVEEGRREFEQACRDAGIRCKVLDRRATENYFTDRAVKAALGSSYSALGPFSTLRGHPHGWNKNRNWQIAAAMTPEELLASDLGVFLQTLVRLPLATPRPGRHGPRHT